MCCEIEDEVLDLKDKERIDPRRFPSRVFHWKSSAGLARRFKSIRQTLRIQSTKNSKNIRNSRAGIIEFA